MDTLTLFSFCFSPLLVALCGRAIWFSGNAAYAALREQIEGGIAPAQAALHPEFYPKLTVLKLLQKGESANLHAFCQQHYPHYQMVFATEASDTAAEQIEAIQKLAQQFPERGIQCVTYSAQPGIDVRVAALTCALKVAQGDIWVLADSTDRPPDYLQHLVQPFRYPSVGAVHGLLRPQIRNGSTSWQALALVGEFYPELLVARQQSGVYFVPNSVVAIRKTAVTQLGGLETAIHDLATGSSLSHRLATIGYRVATWVQPNSTGLNDAPPEGIWTTVQRQLAQFRRMRTLHPWQYALKGATCGTCASLLLLWFWPSSAFIWGVVLLTGLSRLNMVYLIGQGCLKDSTIWRYAGLLPFYDLISFGLWCLGWFGAATQRQRSPSAAIADQPFLAPELAEPEFLGMLVQPAKVKGT
jgi:ceramide glucosyltransferase